MQTCPGNTLILHKKRTTQAKRTKGKRGTPGKHYPKPKATVRQRQANKRRGKKAILYGQNQSKKKSNENGGTVCAHKKRYRQAKNAGGKANARKKLFPMENKLCASLKSRQGHQNEQNSTVRPTLALQSTCQHDKQKFSVSI